MREITTCINISIKLFQMPPKTLKENNSFLCIQSICSLKDSREYMSHVQQGWMDWPVGFHPQI